MSLQQSHHHHRTPKLFHTGSMTEYHEYHLRCALATYVSCFTNTSKIQAQQAAIEIMNDDDAFVKAVQTYKHLVTHYFAAKIEIWMALYMRPVFGVTGGNLAFEFAPDMDAPTYTAFFKQCTVPSTWVVTSYTTMPELLQM